MREALFMIMMLAGLYVVITMSFEAGKDSGYRTCVAEEDDDEPRSLRF